MWVDPDLRQRSLDAIDKAMAETHRLGRQVLFDEALRLHRLALEAGARQSPAESARPDRS